MSIRSPTRGKILRGPAQVVFKGSPLIAIPGWPDDMMSFGLPAMQATGSASGSFLESARRVGSRPTSKS